MRQIVMLLVAIAALVYLGRAVLDYQAYRTASEAARQERVDRIINDVLKGI